LPEFPCFVLNDTLMPEAHTHPNIDAGAFRCIPLI
jgi:hypothetical protein